MSMKNRLRIWLLTSVLCAGMLLSGCSFRQTVNRFLDRSSKEADNLTGTGQTDKEPAKVVDDQLEAPAFTDDLTGSVAVAQGTELRLETAASVSDGGEITYQWYRNNVNSNGGGTLISGAVDPVYNVDTSEAQTVFYYAVATNAHGDAINMTVSGVYQVTVWPKGEWKENDTGFQYLMEDGTFPSDTRLIVDGTLFTINADGYRTDDGLPAPETMKGEAVDAQVIQAAADAKAAAEKEAAEKEAAEKKAAEKAEKKKKKEEKKKKKEAEEKEAAEKAAAEQAAAEEAAAEQTAQ